MHTLLLADENVTVQRVIALTFAEQQINVVSVPDGHQAMEKMAAHRPDIVLAGTSLPHMSGYDLARFMRSKPDLKDVPVLLLTGAFEVVDDARLIASGANGILEKPVEPIAMIGRVKELLGLKSDSKPAVAPRRLTTPAAAPQENNIAPPATPRAGTPGKSAPLPPQHARRDTDEARPGDDASDHGDYLDTLDAAFDTLDQHLAGRAPTAQSSRNPSGPLEQTTSTVDPRSPSPKATGLPPSGNPVYEVDDDWFGDTDGKASDDAKAGRREIAKDLQEPHLQSAKPRSDNPIYEVDDDWFAEDDKARAARVEEQQRLAAEMGIYDVALPEAPAENKPPPPPADDVDLGAEDVKPVEAKTAAAPEPMVESPKPAPVSAPPRPVSPTSPQRIAPMPPPIIAPPRATDAPTVPPPTVAVSAPPAPPAPQAPTRLADDFAALLAFERGERTEPPMPPPPEIKVVAPEITDAMLDQIAKRVADRLSASTFGEQLKDTMSSVMRDTVQNAVSGTVGPVVSETSERVVREVVGHTAERVVREVVSQTAERAVREVLSETTERVVREVVPATAERVVREAVAQTAERIVGEAVSQTTERVVREVVPQTTERVVREVVPPTAERVVREVVPEAAERVVREVVPATAERVVREVVAQTTERTVPDAVSKTTERVAREVIPQTAERAVREVIAETSERLVRDEIERIKSKHQ